MEVGRKHVKNYHCLYCTVVTYLLQCDRDR